MLTVADVPVSEIHLLFERYGLAFVIQPDGEPIKGSYWGEPEAGIVRRTVYTRNDTPVHSVLHEASHLICMPNERRDTVEKNAGGDDLEEAAVCYLQIRLASFLENVGAERLMQDMDEWGYSFRLGSVRRWFELDAEDARGWLVARNLLHPDGAVTFRLRH